LEFNSDFVFVFMSFRPTLRIMTHFEIKIVSDTVCPVRFTPVFGLNAARLRVAY
jgi:hypothetical protein